MKPIQTSADLKMAIRQLELQRDEELILLKEEWQETKEKLKPANLMKAAFKQVTDMPNLKTDVVNAAIGLATGFIAKKLIIGKTLNPLSKLLGTVLEIFVARKASDNAESIKTAGSTIIDKLFKRKVETE